MKYPKEHKESVSKKLCGHAARQLKEGGSNQLSVKSVMDAEGMTVGGFYAHFKSKDELLNRAVEEAFEETLTEFYDNIEYLDNAEWIEVAVSTYLSELHRDSPALGCPAASLLSDVPRGKPELKKYFEKGLKKLVARYEKRLASSGHEDASATATALFALMSGGLQMSRCAATKKYSNEILASCLAAAKTLSQ
jgi:TetR/AcrR family transcriptional regulator, transcriptional repressor for nem operon